MVVRIAVARSPLGTEGKGGMLAVVGEGSGRGWGVKGYTTHGARCIAGRRWQRREGDVRQYEKCLRSTREVFALENREGTEPCVVRVVPIKTVGSFMCHSSSQ